MNIDFYPELSLKSNNDLLDIYINNRNNYQEDYLITIEKILTEREISFQKIEFNTIEEDDKSKNKNYPLDKKLFIKVVIIIFIVAAIGMFGKIAQLKGKLSRDEPIFIYMY